MVEAKFDLAPSLLDLRNKISSFIDGNIEIQEFGDPKTILFRIEKNLMMKMSRKKSLQILKILYLKMLIIEGLNLLDLRLVKSYKLWV